MISKQIKKSIRKRARLILHTYMNDGHIRNNVKPMKFYFKAIKYILTYG
jgi:hypothetical protein